MPQQPAGCPALKIGMIVSASDATQTQEQKAGAEAALKEVNVDGIGKCSVELVVPPAAQTASADQPQRDLQYLAEQGVLAVIAPPDNANAKRVARISRYFNMPVILPGASGDEIIESGSNLWNFRITPTMQAEAQAALDLAKAGKQPLALSVAVVFEQSEFGESAAIQAAEAAQRDGMSIAAYLRFSPLGEDYNEILNTLKNLKPGVLYLISSQPKQASAILDQVSALVKSESAPLVYYTIGHGPAFTNPAFLYKNGQLNSQVDTLIFSVPWMGNDFRLDTKKCQAQGQALATGGLEATSLVRVESYVSLRLLGMALDKARTAGPWKMGDQPVSDWMDLLRTTDGAALFRQTLATSMRGIQTCQIGNMLWPVEFNSDGQNQIPPLLAQGKSGKLANPAQK